MLQGEGVLRKKRMIRIVRPSPYRRKYFCWRYRSLGLTATGSHWVTTRVNHDTIVYQYRSCTQCRCIVPAHCTHSVIQCRGQSEPTVVEEPCLLLLHLLLALLSHSSSRQLSLLLGVDRIFPFLVMGCMLDSRARGFREHVL